MLVVYPDSDHAAVPLRSPSTYSGLRRASLLLVPPAGSSYFSAQAIDWSIKPTISLVLQARESKSRSDANKLAGEGILIRHCFYKIDSLTILRAVLRETLQVEDEAKKISRTCTALGVGSFTARDSSSRCASAELIPKSAKWIVSLQRTHHHRHIPTHP